LIGRQIDELHGEIVEANNDLEVITEISASPEHATLIEASIWQVAELAASEAVSEARRQGVTVDRPDLSDLLTSLSLRSHVLDAMITRDVTAAAVRRAVRLAGGSLDSSGVADQVRTELSARSWAGVRDQLGGAIQGSQNAGRGIVFRRDGEEGDIYSSELLDSNTCGPCREKDGEKYSSMEAAEMDYPFGGYKNCEGRERCRGTTVKVYRSETPPTLEVPGA
jgi:hypothetical protein